MTTEYPFAKYFLFVIVMSISVLRGTPRRAINADSKYRAAPDFAITHKEHAIVAKLEKASQALLGNIISVLPFLVR